MKMSKRFFPLLMSFAITIVSFGQGDTIPQVIKSQFEGKWLRTTKYQTNTIEIKFEPGNDYATFIDIGSGEAPPITLHAFVRGTKLVIPACEHENDYVDMEIVKGKLVLRLQPIIWQGDETLMPDEMKMFLKTTFSKVKQLNKRSKKRKGKAAPNKGQ